MINQEKDRPGQIRRSSAYNIIPTWNDVHAEFVKTYPEEEIIFDKTNVQYSMQSMYDTSSSHVFTNSLTRNLQTFIHKKAWCMKWNRTHIKSHILSALYSTI